MSYSTSLVRIILKNGITVISLDIHFKSYYQSVMTNFNLDLQKNTVILVLQFLTEKSVDSIVFFWFFFRQLTILCISHLHLKLFRPM